MDRVVIIGVGLIGGSLGFALKKAKIKEIEVIGIDTDRNTAIKAQRRSAIDRWERSEDMETVLASASLVIVATPIQAISKIFQTIGPLLPENCVVTDTASTKASVMQWAAQFLPPHVNFVGGHPMAGKERPGIDEAEASLFKGATYCIVPSPSASPAAVETVVGLAQTAGSEPYFVEASEHDLMVGGISHLPLFLASALVAVTSRSPSWREMSRLASSGFRDTSRLASTDVTLSTGITATNTAGVVRWLDEYLEVLQGYRDRIADGQAMEEYFSEARVARNLWVQDQNDPPPIDKTLEAMEIPSFTERMNEMFFGGRLGKMMKRGEDLMEERERYAKDQEKEKERER